MTATGGLALAAAVRVIYRVHGDAAVGGTDALPPIASRFADRYVLVIRVADLADSGHALGKHLARFAGRQLEQRVVAFLGDQLSLGSRRTRHLRALTRLELDCVHGGAGRNVAKRQSVTYKDVGLGTGAYRGAHLQAYWLQDVTLFAVGVVHQGDASRTARIVLDGGYLAPHSKLFALEVNKAQLLLVPAAMVADGQSARVAASAGALADRE